MNILWIYNQPLNPEAGGTERITSLVARGLTDMGHKCLGILEFEENSSKMVYDGSEIIDLYRFLKEHEVDVVINQIAYSTWLIDSFLSQGGAQWHREGGKIISCLHFDPCNPSNLFLLKCNPSKSLRDYVNITKAIAFKFYYDRRQRRQEGQIYNHIYDKSDYMVALSELHFPYLKRVMKRQDYGKLKAINNPLTFQDISDVSTINEKKKVVMVCARMSEYHKRISLILRAWRCIRNDDASHGWTLRIIGDGTDLLRYKRYVADHSLRGVEFLGQRSPEPYYREASIMLLTSSAEGWGLSLTEALQRGVVPVVMDSCPVFSEIIEHGYSGFITPNNDVKTFSRQILQLMSDETMLRNMQANALHSAHRFTLSSTMAKWREIFNS